MSVRAAPHMAGMGLLEAVPESEIQALAAASLTDPDGAVGKLQIIRICRFGYYAGGPLRMACYRRHRRSTDCDGTERRHGCYDHDAATSTVWFSDCAGRCRLSRG